MFASTGEFFLARDSQGATVSLWSVKPDIAPVQVSFAMFVLHQNRVSSVFPGDVAAGKPAIFFVRDFFLIHRALDAVERICVDFM